MPRVRRDDWIQTGLKLLAEEGEHALTVHRLCEVMGKTTGSYYHHFIDHGGFRSVLIAHWYELAEARCAALMDTSFDGGWREGRIQLLSVLGDTGVERAMRIWAWREEEAYRAVERLDQRRVTLLNAIYQAAGLDAEQAQRLAWADYSAVIGSLMVAAPDMTRQAQTELIEARLTAPL